MTKKNIQVLGPLEKTYVLGLFPCPEQGGAGRLGRSDGGAGDARWRSKRRFVGVVPYPDLDSKAWTNNFGISGGCGFGGSDLDSGN